MNSKVLIGEGEQIIAKATELFAKNDLKKDHPDVLWMDVEKMGVEQSKQIRAFLSMKPYSAKGRGVFILHADNLTLDSQNSLLKTLEEPPLESLILLGAQNDKKILTTVLSRCEVIRLDKIQSGKDSENKSDDVEKLLNLSIEERFEFIEKVEDKEVFLNQLVNYFQNQISVGKNKASTDFLKDLLRAEAWNEANGNIRAILEYLMLRLPK